MSVFGPVFGPVLAPVFASPFAAGPGDLSTAVKALFNGGVPGVMFDWTRASNLYQDSARTTLVAANGDPIGSVTDLSGNNKHAGQATSTSRAPWNSAGYAALDGADDRWQTPAIDFSGTDAVTIVAAFRKRSDAALGVVCGLGITDSASVGGFGTYAPGGSGQAGFSALAQGTVGGSFGGSNVTTGYPAPTTVVLSAQFNLAAAVMADKTTLRLNAVSTGSFNGDPGSGSFANAVLHIGMRGNGTFPAAIDLFRLAVIGRELSPGELTGIAERWANQAVGAF